MSAQTSYDAALSNDSLRILSICFGIISISVLLILCLFLLHDCYYKLVRQSKNLFITDRPFNYILFGSWIADTICFMAIYYWTIKHYLYYEIVQDYCYNNYPFNSMDNLYNCNADTICQAYYTFGGSLQGTRSYITDSHLESDCACITWNSCDQCECHSDQGIYAIMCTFWILFVCMNIWEFCRCCIGDILTVENGWISNGDQPNSMDQFASQGLGCYLLCNGCEHQDAVKRLFWKRNLWLNVGDHDRKWICFWFDSLIRWTIQIVLAIIATELYVNGDNVDDIDYGIQRYEVYPILMLFIFKILMQIYYVNGNAYDQQKENVVLILEILENRFGSDIGHKIKLFMPLFYDENTCHEYYLLKQNETGLDSPRDLSVDIDCQQHETML